MVFYRKMVRKYIELVGHCIMNRPFFMPNITAKATPLVIAREEANRSLVGHFFYFV